MRVLRPGTIKKVAGFCTSALTNDGHSVQRSGEFLKIWFFQDLSAGWGCNGRVTTNYVTIAMIRVAAGHTEPGFTLYVTEDTIHTVDVSESAMPTQNCLY